jgi:hypothetical protein
MNYTQAAAAYDKSGGKKTLVPVQYTFVEETVLIGKIIAVEQLPKKGKFKNPSNRYTMDTDDGTVTFLCGAATDKQIKDLVKIGNVYKVAFLGQKMLSGGRKMNNFQWDDITDFITPEMFFTAPPRSRKGKGEVVDV